MIRELYIIHGWTYDISRWDKTIELVEKAGIKIHMLKVPGLTSPSKEIWNIDKYTDWADQNIPDGAVALGHSNGGRILLNLCSNKPNKLHHLILLDSAGIYEKSIKRDITNTLAKIGKPLKKIKFIDKVFHKITGSTDYEHAPENMKRTMENLLNSDKNLQLEKVTTSTTILWGKRDNITPTRQANIMNEKLPNSTLEFFENWPHSAYISYPEELASAIIKTLKGIK